MVHNTFVIERIYEKPVARMFQAFADPAFKRRWFAGETHHACEGFTMDFRVWGAGAK